MKCKVLRNRCIVAIYCVVASMYAHVAVLMRDINMEQFEHMICH